MTCQNCQAQTTPGITLCQHCVTRLSDVLDQIPDALEMVEDTIAKQDRMGSGGAALSGTAESEVPINLEASKRRTELWEAVVSNARIVLGHDDNTDLAGVEPTVYLRMSTDLIQHQDFAGDLLEGLERALHRVMTIVDSRPDVIALGQCGAVHEAIPCPGRLRAKRGDHEARCKICGATYSVAEMQQARAAEAWDHYAPLTDVVKALRVSGFTINPKSAQRWATQGELSVLRYREDGVALYSPGQVIDTHQRMKTRRGRPRKVA